jgi:hypothetical protein
MNDADPANLSIPLDVRCFRTGHLPRSVRFYLAVGCEARRSGHGWVQLCNGDTLFVLEHGDANAHAGGSVPALSAGNLLHLCRRLWSAGIDTSPISYPDCAPGGRITTRDPDLRHVSISQTS